MAGVRKECHENRLKLAVCSTANERAVNILLYTLFGDKAYRWFDVILAGDIVKAKKPDPEIYNLAKEKLALDASSCVVIEDNRNGLMAAKSAGMKCIVTINEYTKNEDFTEADLIVTSLGDKDGERAKVLAGKKDIVFNGEVNVRVLRQIVS